MKKIIFLLAFTAVQLTLRAQTVYDYVLTPISATLEPNQSLNLEIKKLDSTGDLPQTANDLNVGSATTPVWNLNGSSGSNPSNGILHPDLTFLKATYTAPAKVPAKNPVAVSVVIHPGSNPKSAVTLICNIRIVKTAYKVTLKGEITGPEGLHYKVDGESYRNLTSYADGTYALVSYDGSKKMHLRVSTAGVAGKYLLINPLEYDIPVVINIGNIRKMFSVPAKVSIESFSPTKMGGNTAENYWTPKGILNSPGGISRIFISTFYEIYASSVKETGNQAKKDLPFLERLKAHEGDPSYFQTAQGRADLQKMQKYMQSTGHGNLFNNLQKPSTKPSAYSKAFVKGMQGTQTNPGSLCRATGYECANCNGRYSASARNF